MESENLLDNDTHWEYIGPSNICSYGHGPKVPSSYKYSYSTSGENLPIASRAEIAGSWPGPTFVKKPKEITYCYCTLL